MQLGTIDVCAGYGMPVLSNLDLAVHSGEVVVLLGANGAGKTTVTKVLSGELPISSGQVIWNDRPSSARVHKRVQAGLKLVTDERSIVSALTVRENLVLAGGQAERACEIFPELEKLLGRRARLLSGGEQQMVAVGRALSSGPLGLVADELSLGLAPQVTERLLRAVRRAANEAGTAVLLVEQQVRSALEIADRGYVLQRGRVVMEGEAADLLADLANIETAYLSGIEGESESPKDSHV